MTNDDAGESPVSTAVDVLLQLNQHGRGLCPAGADPQVWAGGVLYDLARVAELLDGAVEKVSRKRNDAVAQNAQALATVIRAHRNIELGAGTE